MNLNFSTKISDLNIPLIHKILTQSYWNKGISIKNVEKCIHNSLNFGLYLNNQQIGYARVVTDYYRFAYLLDVFIVEEQQAKGYGKKLMEYILNHPSIKEVSTWKLGTKDAHGLYQQFGFQELKHPERIMERISNPIL